MVNLIGIIKKNLTPHEYNKALRLGEPSIELVRNEVRVYPNKNLFSLLEVAEILKNTIDIMFFNATKKKLFEI